MSESDKNLGLGDIFKGVLKDTGLQKVKDDFTKGLGEEVKKRLSDWDANKVAAFLAENYDIKIEFSKKEKKRGARKKTNHESG